MRMRTVILLASLLGAASSAAREPRPENTVAVGPGFVKGQKSEHALGYRAPDGWIADAAAAKEYGLSAVLVPAGSTLASANAAITIAFQRKDLGKPGLRTLEAFYRVDLQNMIAQYPALEAARWQPRGLDPDRVRFMSIELGGKGVSPQRVVYLDAGDGYYSVTLTVEDRPGLASPAFERFFDSLAVR